MTKRTRAFGLTTMTMTLAAGGALLAGAANAETTGVTGGGQPINNYQPSLVMTQSVQTVGVYPSRDGGCCQNYIGQVHTFAGNFSPYGNPTANGQFVAISQNEALYSLTGTTYGGDGVNTFELPNLAGRTVIGAGQGPGLSDRLQGQVVGSAADVMTLAQLPAHDHSLPGGGVTGVTGSAAPAPLNNMQPSLALNYGIAVQGYYPSQSGGAGEPFLGEVSAFSGTYVPGGYLPAAGQLLPINQFAALFSLLGTTYGGDGVRTFALPNLEGRTIVGAGQGPGLANVQLGEQFGSETTVLTDANLPPDVHSLPGGGFTGPNGGGLPFDNEQPSLGLNYLIALNGVYPSRDGGGGWSDTDPTLGEVVAFAGNFAPQGWALAQGQLLSINQNTALFSLIGCFYGGDCVRTFALPDLRGRTILGAGGDFTVGETLGEQDHVLTVAELVPHDHTLPVAVGVPEPAAWALMLGGFGLIGGVLRARRRVAAA